MISFAFLLCSTLLLSGVIAVEETSIDIAQDYIIDPADPLHVEVGKKAAAAAIRVLNDILDGKDLQKSLLDRGIEGLGQVRGVVASMGKNFLKRLRELKEGVPIGKVAANIWKSIHSKFSGKNKKYDEIVQAAGAENIEHFIEKTTEVIKEAIMEAMKKRKEAAVKAKESAPTNE